MSILDGIEEVLSLEARKNERDEKNRDTCLNEAIAQFIRADQFGRLAWLS